MIEGMEAVTTAALGLALDAASLRQQAAAANIANASTAGYAPVRVAFEEQMETARRSLEASGRIDAAALAEAQPRIEAAPAGEGGVPARVLLDIEVAEMARNAVHYQALLKGLARHYAILGTAIADGKK